LATEDSTRVLQGGGMVGDSERRRQADAPRVRRHRIRDRTQRALAPGGAIEQQADRACVEVVQLVSAGQIDLDGLDPAWSARPVRSREVPRRIRRPGIAVAPVADEQQAVAIPRLERRCLGVRQDRRRPQRADGGRDRDERRIEGAGESQPRAAQASQVTADRRDERIVEERVRVPVDPLKDARTDARRPGAGRGRHVEAAVGPVGGRHALGGEEDPRAAF
jgi:hypothetical protein